MQQVSRRPRGSAKFIPMFNPKTTQDQEKKWTHFAGLCKSCGLCVKVCPVKCLDFDEKRLTRAGMSSIKCDIKKCIACSQCERICPDVAILVERIKNDSKE